MVECSEVAREFIDKYSSDQMRSKIGAESAWRGFILQALYIANRVSDVDENTVFLPETVEDLLILKYAGTDKESVELVQVKSVSGQKLSISQLKPCNKSGKINEDSFFGRLYEAWKRNIRTEAKLIVFGEVGESLKNIDASFEPGSEFRTKFVNSYGYPEKYCIWLQKHLCVEIVNENDLNAKLVEVLRANVETQAAVRAASAYLKGKLYEACRHRESLSLARWRDLLTEFGTQQASNREFQSHYGTTIVPLMEYLNEINEDDVRAKEEYMSGSSATPKHIALNLDIKRCEWQKKIDQAFSHSNIVIMRGASGQGKSTLCYRWLMGRNGLSNVYLIGDLTSLSAPQIAACLRGLAKEQMIYAYIEADANVAWVSFLKEVSRISNRHLRILVSVRNDDASRSGYDANLIVSAEISLYLTKHEAQEFYNKVCVKRHKSFEDAWHQFGENGPLLEFMYFLNHEITLRDKLDKQINSFIESGEDSWVHFLYLASVTGSCGLPAKISTLAAKTGCRDVIKLLTLLDSEMLFRSSDDNLTVRPLHPVRAQLIAEILETVVYLQREQLLLDACACAVGDFTPILVSYLKYSDFTTEGYRTFVKLASRSWSSCAQALRLMLWKDANNAFQGMLQMRPKIEMQHIPLLYVAFLAFGIHSKHVDEVDTLLKLVEDPSQRATIKDVALEFASKYKDRAHTERYLRAISCNLPAVEEIVKTPSSAGFVLYIMAEMQVDSISYQRTLKELNLLDVTKSCDLDGMLDLCFALTRCNIRLSQKWVDQIQQLLCERDNIVAIFPEDVKSESGGSGFKRRLMAYVVPHCGTGASNDSSQDYSVNAILVRAVYDLRRIWPGYDLYGAKLIGLEGLITCVETFDLQKNISSDLLVPTWSTIYNQYLFAMCQYEECPYGNWSELEGSLRAAVSAVFAVFGKMLKFLRALCDERIDQLRHVHAELFSAIDDARALLVAAPRVAPRSVCDSASFRLDSGSSVLQADISAADTSFVSVPGRSTASERFLSLDHLNRFFSSFSSLVENFVDVSVSDPGSVALSSNAATKAVSYVCSLVDLCNREFRQMFGGVDLIPARQRRMPFQLLGYLYYFDSVSTSSSAPMLAECLKQALDLSSFVDRFVEALGHIGGVKSARYDRISVIDVCVDSPHLLFNPEFLYSAILNSGVLDSSLDGRRFSKAFFQASSPVMVGVSFEGLYGPKEISYNLNSLVCGALSAEFDSLSDLVGKASPVVEGVDLVRVHDFVHEYLLLSSGWLDCVDLVSRILSEDNSAAGGVVGSVLSQWVKDVLANLRTLLHDVEVYFIKYPVLRADFETQYLGISADMEKYC